MFRNDILVNINHKDILNQNLFVKSFYIIIDKIFQFLIKVVIYSYKFEKNLKTVINSIKLDIILVNKRQFKR